MKFYLQVMQFNFARNLAYPSELLAAFVRKLIFLAFLVIFWNIIFLDQSDIDTKGLASYFLVANGIAEIVMANETRVGRYIRRRVKMGVIATDMIKPINIIPYIYFSSQGKNLISTIYGFIIILIGILLQPPQSLLALFLFILFFINAVFIGLAFNLLEGTLSLLITEVTGIKNALRHIGRILSGMLVPLTFFPEAIKDFAELTLFPYMVFIPADMLRVTEVNGEIVRLFLISTSWSISGMLFILFFWNWAVKKFEAIGI